MIENHAKKKIEIKYSISISSWFKMRDCEARIVDVRIWKI